MLNNFLSTLIFGTSSSNGYANGNVETNTDNTTNKSNTTTVNTNMDELNDFDFIDRKDIDWILVNPFDSQSKKSQKRKSKKLNLSVSLTASGYALQSLFNEPIQVVPNARQQQQFDDADEAGQSVPKSTEKPKDTWLITPLPSLRSISTSQRSIVESGLENLLIEHPSMSVFIASSSEDLRDEYDEVRSGELTELVTEKENASPAIRKRKNKKNKNKDAKKDAQQQQQQSTLCNSVTKSASPKKSIKSYLQANNQVSAKKRVGTNLNSLRLSQLYNVNTSMKMVVNVNTRQRKYHNLQQPQSFFSQHHSF